MSRDSGPTVTTTAARIAVFSPWLLPFVGEDRPLGGAGGLRCPSAKAARQLAAVAGTGPGPTDDGACAYAKRHQLPFLRVELGLYCSAVRGRKARPWSLVVSPPGPVQAPTGSEYEPIERLLSDKNEALETTELLARARSLRHFIVENQLSRFADAFVVPELPGTTNPETKAVVVVVPYTAVKNADALDSPMTSLVRQLVDRALAEHPDAPVGLLFEVEPLSGRAARLPKGIVRHPRLFALPVDVDRALLLERCAHVYTKASTFGFEALLRKVPVTVLGNPFYAGWGLTRDLNPTLQRKRRRSLDELVAAALLQATCYLDPVRQCQTTAEAALEHLRLQRSRFLENQGRFLCVGFSLWKRAIVKAYLTSKGNEVCFLGNAIKLQQTTPKVNTKVLVWASRPHEDIERFALTQGLELWRLEDGFLRSVGLGSDWSTPGSLVFDPKGIYYDPRRPSQLETLLQTIEFSDQELAQAEDLRALIVALRVSKYNSLADRAYSPQPQPNQRVILVPGQVADDASVRFGGSHVGGIGNLLQTVRRRAPDAHILYKPHPDVLSGNRRGHVNEGLGTWFDELVLDVPIARCLECVDEVHTISSLVGFEALLRKIPVVCHGQPFYAGWGLTEDRVPILRRQRNLTLPMLVAGTLMRYPRYYHFPSGCFCSAAQMVGALSVAIRSEPPARRQPKILRRLSSLLQLAKDLRHVG